MISTLLTLTLGIYGGLFIAKKGITTFDKAFRPIQATCRFISNQFFTKKKDAEQRDEKITP